MRDLTGPSADAALEPRFRPTTPPFRGPSIGRAATPGGGLGARQVLPPCVTPFLVFGGRVAG